jgi:aminoglycoside phosphotransferase (APT) family kinase protein
MLPFWHVQPFFIHNTVVGHEVNTAMSAETEFVQENFLRATHQANQARIVAHVLLPVLHEIFPHLFDRPPAITPVSGQGWSNLTLHIDSRNSEHGYILRLSPRKRGVHGAASKGRSLPHYEKEQLVLECLQAYNFVPRLVPHGTGALSLLVPGRGEVEFAYSLQGRFPFRAAREVAAGLDRQRCLEQLGGIVRTIHGVLMQGYGTDFDESTGAFAHASFEDFILSKISAIEQLNVATRMKSWLIQRAEQLVSLEPEPRLYHRDLLGNWGNFLVDDEGNVSGIIDWEFAGVGAALQYEIASMVYVLTRDGASSEEIERDLCAVLRGYGLSRGEYRASYERDVETLVLLNSVSALAKFDVLQQQGGLEKEPWRRRFAERATHLCERCFLLDRAA